MRYDREFLINGMPYRHFVSDVMWSAVLVAITGVFLFGVAAPAVVIAVACGAVAAGLGKMIYGRVLRERARHAPAHRPRMARLMERYGSMPRRQSVARSMT